MPEAIGDGLQVGVPGIVDKPDLFRQETSSPLDRYRVRASELNIQPVEKRDWLTVDGVKYAWGSETEEAIASNTDGRVIKERLKQMGTYDVNNGTVAFIDDEGRINVGHATEENFGVLEKHGYIRGSFWVPFSNGEVPVDIKLRQQYFEMRQKGIEANKQRNIREHIRIYSEIAEKKGVKPVEGGMWMMVDGIEYRGWGNEAGRVDVNTDGYNMAIRRVDQVGTYDSNNGRVAFVDHQGGMWVGASTRENWEALTQAGYKRGSIWVPFSNGEVPADREIYQQLRDVLTGKRAEQLRAERNARVEAIVGLRRELFGEIAELLDREELYQKVSEGAERQYLNTERMTEERLQPRIEKDNVGFERRIYTMNGATFSFKGREELPVYPTLENLQTISLGETPNWVEPEDYQKWQERLKLTQTQDGGPEHFAVNKTLLGVVELAIQLGSKDVSLSQVRDELINGVYSARALSLIDMLIAAGYVRFGGFAERANQNGEAIVLLSLLGDTQAQAAVVDAVEDMRKINRDEKVNLEREKAGYEPLKPQELICVYATKYRPEIIEDRGFLIETTFDATNGKVLRNTIHTAFNHKVASHMYGSWGDAGYVVISPFEKMVEKNGLPSVLNTVDTYWARNPGELLVFADATLIAPGGGGIEGLYQEEGNVIKFKSEGLERQDLINLAANAKRNGYFDSFSRDIERVLDDAFHPYGFAKDLKTQWDFAAIQRSISIFFYQDEHGWGHQPELLRFLTAEAEGQTEIDIETRLRMLVEQSGAIDALKPEIVNKEGAVSVLAKSLADRIKSVMFTEINELAVREAIRRRGFTVQPGGMWAWADSWKVTGQTVALGEELGVPVGAHTSMVDHELSERFNVGVNRAIEAGGSKFNWTQYNPRFDDLIARLDPKTRRAVYASGSLAARL